MMFLYFILFVVFVHHIIRIIIDTFFSGIEITITVRLTRDVVVFGIEVENFIPLISRIFQYLVLNILRTVRKYIIVKRYFYMCERRGK